MEILMKPDVPEFEEIVLTEEDFAEEEVAEVEVEDAPVAAPTYVLPVKRVNYLNNKDMLREIHNSKNTYSEYTEPKYSDYDVIVENLSDIFLPETLEKAQVTRAARLSAIAYEAVLANAVILTKADKPRLIDHKIKPDTISPDDLVYRVLGFDHIPLAPGRKKTVKSVADAHVKLNFYPFKHFIIVDGEPVEVGRSHSKKGKFSLDHGMITNKLAKMFILLVEKYGQRGNWRNYTYLDEMKGQALLQLSQMCLQFDEYKSENPFSYLSQSCQNSFTRVFNLEKKNQDLRDDLLIDSGASPSFSRQLAFEDEVRRLREDALDSAKHG